jgi:hypothetical protein
MICRVAHPTRHQQRVAQSCWPRAFQVPDRQSGPAPVDLRSQVQGDSSSRGGFAADVGADAQAGGTSCSLRVGWRERYSRDHSNSGGNGNFQLSRYSSPFATSLRSSGFRLRIFGCVAACRPLSRNLGIDDAMLNRQTSQTNIILQVEFFKDPITITVNRFGAQ